MPNNRKKILVTGGAGFVGTNLIKFFLKKTKFNIISLDNYSSGSKKNHIKSNRIKYIKGHTKNIIDLVKDPKNIHSVFHFGEFARIYQSFIKMNDCVESNFIGSNEVFNFCLKYNIKLVYSATSASLGNKGSDKNLSPYAFSKATNLEQLENFKKCFKFKYEVIYFYNVYGPHQISKGTMSTVIGIFEDHYLRKKPLPVVMPGTQTRRFTHIDDTIETCYLAWKKKLNRHYIIANTQSYSISEVAKMFKSKIRYLPRRSGERYSSALVNKNLSNKIYKFYGKISLKNYISEFIENHS
ncbi:NAD-dependent epimerase/dehydratase family protein [Pelagibacterales bacterium SAG-MED05]|nr:NAD-dependent epimerase/dehydratase family protein [Pelagibacterales bacterium SAG-MED05]